MAMSVGEMLAPVGPTFTPVGAMLMPWGAMLMPCTTAAMPPCHDQTSVQLIACSTVLHPDAVLSHVRGCRSPIRQGILWGAAKLTVAPMPTPTGLTAMAQGETPTPVKPKFRAATESWNRLVLEEKKVGGVMATAFFITWHSIPACQGCFIALQGLQVLTSLS